MKFHPASIVIIVILLPLFWAWYSEMPKSLLKDAMNRDEKFLDRYIAFIMFLMSLAIPIALIFSIWLFGAILPQ